MLKAMEITLEAEAPVFGLARQMTNYYTTSN
jgi:hypothetical protein